MLVWFFGAFVDLRLLSEFRSFCMVCALVTCTGTGLKDPDRKSRSMGLKATGINDTTGATVAAVVKKPKSIASSTWIALESPPSLAKSLECLTLEVLVAKGSSKGSEERCVGVWWECPL